MMNGNCKFGRTAIFALLILVLSAASVSLAHAQTFSISMPNGLSRPAVDPGGSAIGTIDITASGGFNGPVAFTCVVSSGPATSDPPVCTISPTSQTAPGSVSLTITTSGSTAQGLYNFTVTGSSGALAPTLSLNLTVQPLSEDYTLSVTPTVAVPNPVAPGAVATATVTVAPLGSYSGHQVTLSCLSVTPVVTAAPSCSFQPTSGTGAVQVTGGVPATATLTITTYGPLPTTTELKTRRMFYALWLLLPGLALAGVVGGGKRRRMLTALFFVLSLSGGLLLTPACSSSPATNSPTGDTTPKNTYVFTLTGADENGAAPSNTSANAPTVSITVN